VAVNAQNKKFWGYDRYVLERPRTDHRFCHHVKRRTGILVGSLLGIVGACAGPGTNQQLRSELLEMGRADQELHRRGSELMQGLPATQAEFVTLVAEQKRTDAARFARLEDIVNEYGWPGYSLVGRDASGAALIILKHADLQQQKRFLPILRSAAEAGEIAPSQVASLVDKIRVGDGEKQLYGTLVVSDSEGKPVLAPVEDPRSLDERREKVGLPPIDKQLEQMEREIGRPIGRGNLAAVGEWRL
jgi:hypothetical protein